MMNILRSIWGWILVWLFFFFVSLNTDDKYPIAVAMFFTGLQVIVFYGNLEFLLPRYYDENNSKKYYKYVIIFWFSILLGIYLTDSLFIPEGFFADEGDNINDHEPDGILRYFFYSIIMGLAFFVSLSIGLQRHQIKLQKKFEELKRENVDNELKFLKSQINPHFLFNALNNIYSLTYSGNENAPDQILSLSDMLRFVLYDCKEDYIPLIKELSYIEHYIIFQQIKTTHEQNISYNIPETKDLQIKIAPMILIPFIENSFKHSLIEKDKTGFVNIKVHFEAKSLSFEIENSKPQMSRAHMLVGEGGIGLDNVKKRLNLIYPDKHKLSIQDQDTFKVILKIELT
ncbi:sensor histidine kinase [Aquimarina rhabdastrellae]